MDNTRRPVTPNVTNQPSNVHSQHQVAQPEIAVPQRPGAGRPPLTRNITAKMPSPQINPQGGMKAGTGSGLIGVFGADSNGNPEIIESPASIITTNNLTTLSNIDAIAFKNPSTAPATITTSTNGTLSLGSSSNPVTIDAQGDLGVAGNLTVTGNINGNFTLGNSVSVGVMQLNGSQNNTSINTGSNPLTIQTGGQLNLSSTTGTEVQGNLVVTGDLSLNNGEISSSSDIVLTPGIGNNVSVAAPLVLYTYPGNTPPSAENGTIVYNNNQFLFCQNEEWLNLNNNSTAANIVGTQGQIVVNTNAATNTSTISIADSPKVSGTLSIQGINSGFSNSAVNKSQAVVTVSGATTQMLDLFSVLNLFSPNSSSQQQNGVVVCTAVVSAIAYNTTTSAFVGCAGYDMGIQAVQIANGQVQLTNNSSTSTMPVDSKYSQNFTAPAPVWCIDYTSSPTQPALALNLTGIAGSNINYICSFEYHILPINTN